MRVALVTEGTYPFERGGVATWCEQLITGLPDHEFDVVAIVAHPFQRVAYTLPPNAQHVTMMRALVKETLSREMVDTLAADIARACQTLDDKGGVHESERQRVKTSTGY